jgi:hypothetical protein
LRALKTQVTKPPNKIQILLGGFVFYRYFYLKIQRTT